MREERLIVRPFDDFQVLDYKSNQEVNEHARAEVRGCIPLARKEDYIKIGQKQEWVQIVTISEEEFILFYGVIEKLQIEVDSKTCIICLYLSSGTKLMDYEEHVRSFQNTDLTYSSLLDTCNQGYENTAKIMAEGKGVKIPHFIMQYLETDWEFIKRLAAMNHTAVFANCSTQEEKYHFGIPDKREIIESSPIEYRTQYDMQEYWYKKKYGAAIHQSDTMSLIWETRKIHRLGDKMTVNRKELFIWKIDSYLKGNEIYHTCYVKPYNGLHKPVYYNDRITGVSLLGSVIKVRNEMVQMKIYSDKNIEGFGSCWYSYSTDSSPDGAVWYCMPEIGDTVRLYFPSAKEEEAYVSSVYHESGSE